MSVVYMGVSLIGLLVLVFSFCSKCPCRVNDCGHDLFGRITKFLPARHEIGYNFWDYLGVIVPLVFILAFPQFWLWQYINVAIIFWALFILALIVILMKVCPGCKNNYCPLNKGDA